MHINTRTVDVVTCLLFTYSLCLRNLSRAVLYGTFRALLWILFETMTSDTDVLHQCVSVGSTHLLV